LCGDEDADEGACTCTCTCTCACGWCLRAVAAAVVAVFADFGGLSERMRAEELTRRLESVAMPLDMASPTSGRGNACAPVAAGLVMGLVGLRGAAMGLPERGLLGVRTRRRAEDDDLARKMDSPENVSGDIILGS